MMLPKPSLLNKVYGKRHKLSIQHKSEAISDLALVLSTISRDHLLGVGTGCDPLWAGWFIIIINNNNSACHYCNCGKSQQ